EKPVGTISERVLALIAEVEAKAGARLELALIRAQLAEPAKQLDIARELSIKFPEALAARVAQARIALVGGDAGQVKDSLDVLVGDGGQVAGALRGRWQCSLWGHRPGPFSWRCGACRRWGTLRMETGVEPPPVPPRERRQAPRPPRPEGLLGATPDVALPTPT